MISSTTVFMESTEWDIEDLQLPAASGICGCARIGNMVTLSKEDGASHSSRLKAAPLGGMWLDEPHLGSFTAPFSAAALVAANTNHRHLYIHASGCAPSTPTPIHPPKRLLFLSSVHIWMILTLQQCFQVSLLAVDEMHMSLPKMKKDIYWDDSAARPPYTLAAADYCIPSFLGSTVQMA